MARLPKVLEDLKDIEKIGIANYVVLDKKRTSIEVTSTDGREYLVFSNNKVAKECAVEMFVKYEDDPDVLEQLDMLGKPLVQYASECVENNGVQYVLSYDQHHKVQLNKAVAYRTI